MKPPQGHALTERDLEDLGVSEEEASDAATETGQSAAEASGEGAEGWEILSPAPRCSKDLD